MDKIYLYEMMVSIFNDMGHNNWYPAMLTWLKKECHKMKITMQNHVNHGFMCG